MRTPLTLTLLAATMLLVNATASVGGWTDIAGDQAVFDAALENGDLFGIADLGIAVIDCRDAATDLRALTVTSEAGVITLTMRVSDLGSRHISCGFTEEVTTEAYFEATLQPVAICRPITLGSTCSVDPDVPAVLVDATRRDTDEIIGCISLHFDGGVHSVCLGAPVQSGTTTLTWTLPLAGAVLMDNGDTLQYDLAGVDVRPEAYASSYAEIVSLYDEIYPEFEESFVL